MDGLKEGASDGGLCIQVRLATASIHGAPVIQDYWDSVNYFRLFRFYELERTRWGVLCDFLRWW